MVVEIGTCSEALLANRAFKWFDPCMNAEVCVEGTRRAEALVTNVANLWGILI